MTFKEAEKVYQMHGLKLKRDPFGYPYTVLKSDESKDFDLYEFDSDDVEEISEAFLILAG